MHRRPTGGTGLDAPPSSTTTPCPPRPTWSSWAAGYTGLSAAWELARRGRRHVVVVDGADIGRGASGRNGGMVHPGGKHDLATMLAMARGRDMWDDTVAAFEGVEALVAELGHDCDWRRSGHLELAGHPRHAAHLRAVAEAYDSIGEEARFLTADRSGRRDRLRPFRRRPPGDPQRVVCIRPSWWPPWPAPPWRPGPSCTDRPRPGGSSATAPGSAW